MKKSTQAFSLFIGAAMILQIQGCYGNFALTRKVYTLNGTFGDKWINSLAMFAMCVVPVYEAAGFVDFFILNTIQFWTGANPVALKAGEKEIQVVQWKGNNYQLTATSNRMDVQQIIDGKVEAPVSVVYNIQSQSWDAISGKEVRKIVEWVGDNGQLVDLIYPDGHKQRVDLTDTESPLATSLSNKLYSVAQ